MAASPHFAFVSDLAAAWRDGAICLPSFPDIVIRIRRTLARDDVSVDRVVKVVKTDPALTSKLLVFANSAAHNPGGHRIDSVRDAVSRLGFDLVRNTAVALAVRQMFLGEKHRDIAPALRAVWQESMQLAAMCAAVAEGRRPFDQDTAFLAGLLHFVGKLYILTRAGNYPGFADDPESLESIIADWHPKVGVSVVQSWGFSEDLARSVDTADNLSPYTSKAPDLVDVVAAAERMLEIVRDAARVGVRPDALADGGHAAEDPAMQRLGIVDADLPQLYRTFQDKVGVVRDALAG